MNGLDLRLSVVPMLHGFPNPLEVFVDLPLGHAAYLVGREIFVWRIDAGSARRARGIVAVDRRGARSLKLLLTLVKGIGGIERKPLLTALPDLRWDLLDRNVGKEAVKILDLAQRCLSLSLCLLEECSKSLDFAAERIQFV